jgi:drug/metabolite transporter (DMT)-like permease
MAVIVIRITGRLSSWSAPHVKSAVTTANETRKAWLQIHFCVVLWGFIAIFGRLISLPALPLVWWRMTLVAAILVSVPRVWRGLRTMSPRLIAAYSGVGCIIALHWLTFYGSIKLSNASVGATCMALAPVFLSIVEPLIVRRPFNVRELLLGVIMVPGVVMVIGGVPPGMRSGIALGVLSAVFVAIFGTLNKRLVHHADALAVTALELAAGALLLTIFGPLLGPATFQLPSLHDAILLLILAVGCTILPFTLALIALRHLSAFATQLAVNLEPVYAIILGSVLLHEHRELGPLFYGGVAIILGAVLTYPLLVREQPAPPLP